MRHLLWVIDQSKVALGLMIIPCINFVFVMLLARPFALESLALFGL